MISAWSLGWTNCALVHLKRERCGEFGDEAQLVDGSILHHLDAGDTNLSEILICLSVEQRHIQEVRRVEITAANINSTFGRSGPENCRARIRLLRPMCLPIRSSCGVTKLMLDELRQLLHGNIYPKLSVPRLIK